MQGGTLTAHFGPRDVRVYAFMASVLEAAMRAQRVDDRARTAAARACLEAAARHLAGTRGGELPSAIAALEREVAALKARL